MKLVFIAESMDGRSGGIQRVAHLISKCLLEPSEYSVEIISAKELPTELKSSNIWSANNKKWLFWLKAVSVVRRADMVIYDHLGTARVHSFASKKAKSVAFIHGIEVWKETAPPKRLKTVEKMDYLITNSQFTKTKALEHLPVFKNAKVCWLSTLEDGHSKFEVPLNQRRAQVVILGRMKSGRDKGHEALIELWGDVLEKNADARLVIIGIGDDQERLKRLAESKEYAESIEFTGFLENEDVEKRLAQSKLLCMPSRGEGFGLVYIEAMRLGVPVIASIQDAGQEVNVDGETGFNIDLDKQSELIESINHVLSNQNEFEKMGKNALQRWEHSFNYKSFSDRFLSIISEMTGINS